MDINTQHD